MGEWWRQQVASGFAAFRGAHMAGSLPIGDGLLTELIREWLAAAARPATVAAQSPPTTDVAALARLVRHVSVRASDGVVTLDFEVRVEGDEARAAHAPPGGG